MDIQTLRWFQEVADGATVTEVSEIYDVSQPGVSRALARLETEVGSPLLTKHGRVLRLTQAGVTFKRHVDALMADYDDGLAAVSELVAPETGTVRLGFQPSYGMWLVPALIAGFRRDHPLVRYTLVRRRATDRAVDVVQGRLDLDITDNAPGVPELRWEYLFAEPLMLALPASHPLMARHPYPIDLAELAGADFVTLDPAWRIATLAHELCRRAGFEPRIGMEVDDIATMRGLVAAGLGVAILPAMGAAPGLVPRSSGPAFGLLPLKDPMATREIGVVSSIERRLLPAAESFRRYLLDHAGRLAVPGARA